jgi:hypothetical protein
MIEGVKNVGEEDHREMLKGEQNVKMTQLAINK